MPARRVVVDGSNIATEGRTLPSLRQLNEAVLAFLNEYPETEVTVIVDATFGHRIDPAERAEFEEAEANSELVSPPAGAIGRGDAFLLRIAGKIGATVLSNDSFQEFHGDHEWLFEDGRLIGGKPVPGIGWIFTPRTPVRGVKSRKAVKDAKKGKAPVLAAAPTISGEDLGPRPVPSKPPPRRRGGARPDASSPPSEVAVAEAIATATEESVSGNGGGRRRRRKKRGGRPAEPVNEALAFINFIAAHPLGSELEGEVETFTSHGAFVQAGGARCYVPISALGDPPPRAARDVLGRGERRRFVVQALDPQRRGVELSLPEFVHVAGAPLPETIAAEIEEADEDDTVEAPPATAGRRRRGSRGAGPATVPSVAVPSGRVGDGPPAGTDLSDAVPAGPTRRSGVRRNPAKVAATAGTNPVLTASGPPPATGGRRPRTAAVSLPGLGGTAAEGSSTVTAAGLSPVTGRADRRSVDRPAGVAPTGVAEAAPPGSGRATTTRKAAKAPRALRDVGPTPVAKRSSPALNQGPGGSTAGSGARPGRPPLPTTVPVAKRAAAQADKAPAAEVPAARVSPAKVSPAKVSAAKVSAAAKAVNVSAAKGSGAVKAARTVGDTTVAAPAQTAPATAPKVRSAKASSAAATPVKATPVKATPGKAPAKAAAATAGRKAAARAATSTGPTPEAASAQADSPRVKGGATNRGAAKGGAGRNAASTDSAGNATTRSASAKRATAGGAAADVTPVKAGPVKAGPVKGGAGASAARGAATPPASAAKSAAVKRTPASTTKTRG